MNLDQSPWELSRVDSNKPFLTWTWKVIRQKLLPRSGPGLHGQSARHRSHSHHHRTCPPQDRSPCACLLLSPVPNHFLVSVQKELPTFWWVDSLPWILCAGQERNLHRILISSYLNIHLQQSWWHEIYNILFALCNSKSYLGFPTSKD